MKKLLTIAVLILAAAPLLAQVPGPPGPPPGGPMGPGAPGPQQAPPEAVLKDVLGFTDAQLSAFQSLVQTRQQGTEPLVRQLGEAQKALGEALKADAPDAAAVGARLLAVRSIEKQIGAVGEAFRAGLENLLSSEQKAKLSQIFATADAVRAAEALHRLGL